MRIPYFSCRSSWWLDTSVASVVYLYCFDLFPSGITFLTFQHIRWCLLWKRPDHWPKCFFHQRMMWIFSDMAPVDYVFEIKELSDPSVWQRNWKFRYQHYQPSSWVLKCQITGGWGLGGDVSLVYYTTNTWILFHMFFKYFSHI